MDKLAAMLASLLLAFAAQCSPPAAIPVYRDYTPMAELKGVADAYACPTLFDWDGDGLLDLVVGEITTNCTGKARLYLNRGTAKEARFDDYSYLQKNGKDIEFSAKGCIGLQIGFGKAGDITMFLSTSNGKIYGWNPSSRKPGTDEQIDFVTWFDHSTDERFSRLIRSCTFCADIDGDGCDDLVVSGQNSPIFWVKRSGSGEDSRVECFPMLDGTGIPLRYPEGQSHASAVMFDASGDGIVDIVTGDTTGNVWMYLGLGDGRYSAFPAKMYANRDTANIRSRLGVGDLDGDGIEEILVGRQDGSVLILKGERSFSPIVAFKLFGSK